MTLPNVFNHIPMGQFWGSLFFVFMTFAAFSTVLAVFETIVSSVSELTGWEPYSYVIERAPIAE
jgi:NSS family neurotransmitter:Na+ symporter